MPFYIDEPITIESLSVDIGTAGGGAGCTFGAAIYQNGTGSTGYRPYTLLGKTVGSVSTSTGTLTLSMVSNVSITQQGWYWLGFQYGDGSMKLYTQSPYTPMNAAQFMGSAVAAHLIGAGLEGVSIPGTVQTWPNPAAGTFTEISNVSIIPFMWLQLASVP